MCDIWNHLYDKFYAEFPGVKYCSKRNIPGRYKITPGSQPGIHYSDKGTVLTQIQSHKFFNEMMEADYLINIPTLKGHRWAGVTFFAKNHFGSNTSDGSWQLHEGLMNPDNAGMRYGYRLYRVLVDLMGSRHLGGKTMLYFMEGLWATSYEHQPPQKFTTAPFNNDWCSSLFFSLDPVAIESVCLDILQKEFTREDKSAKPPRYAYVQWDGIDDYLHQAADSGWWPEGIVYDPDNSGKPIGSLGVHEHWNNPVDMHYSRNLRTGNGIELVYLPEGSASFTSETVRAPLPAVQCYPTHFTDRLFVKAEVPGPALLNVEIVDLLGKRVLTESFFVDYSGQIFLLETDFLKKGMYLALTSTAGKQFSEKVFKE